MFYVATYKLLYDIRVQHKEKSAIVLSEILWKTI